jgi:hypothetical protein
MCTSVSHIYNNEGKSTINLGVDMHLWSCYIKKRGNYIEDRWKKERIESIYKIVYRSFDTLNQNR